MNEQQNQEKKISTTENQQAFFSEDHINKIKNEYDLLKNIYIPGVRVMLGYQHLGNQVQVEFERIESQCLHIFFETTTLTLTEQLSIFKQTAQILAQVHEEGIIHKDLNPANLLITQDQKVYLIGFGIASRFTLKQPNLGNPEKLEGTLAYISPEQTGRINRSVDYRTDLYALGIVFYELIVGQLPFTDTDPLGLIHAHLAKTPISPFDVNHKVPLTVSNIIMKLLRKDPEDRYQSALGVVKDLIKCLQFLNKGGAIINFDLGQEDFSGKLQIPEKLYGREKETQMILESFERVKSGAIELTLVAGSSGTGKSILISETHRPLANTKGYFIEGKFDQFQRNIPFYAWIQAFKHFVNLLLTENEKTLLYWKNIILAAIGDNGGVLTEVVPSLELVIGRQPVSIKLAGQEAQNRFNYVMQNFVQAITTREHPLIIFIDDLQWADLASLDLLKTLVTDAENAYLLCVGAYRDNEVFASHPLVSLIQEIKEEGQNINEIVINNLSEEAVLEMLSETLSMPKDDQVSLLSQNILDKTRGNAFFTHRFLKNLYEEGLLQFDFERMSWVWDNAKIVEANFTDNVVEFMAQKVASLSDNTRQLLEWAACIGNNFDLAALQIIAKKKDLQYDLEKAVLENLIFPTQYQQYRFIHDRVQQAAYSLIPKIDKQTTHLKIGQLLYDSYSQEQRSERIFDIANHYNLAKEILIEDDTKIALELNQQAALKAKDSASFDGMLTYIQQAEGLLPENAWQQDYSTTLKVYKILSEAHYLNSNFEQTNFYSNEVIQHANDVVSKGEVSLFLVFANTVQGKYQKAIDISIEALAWFGVIIPVKEDIVKEVQYLTQKILSKFKSRDEVENIILNLPVSDSESFFLIMELLFGIDPPSYITGNISLYNFISVKAIILSMERGNTPLSAKGFANFGFLYSLIFKGDYQLGNKITETAVTLAHRFNDKKIICRTTMMQAAFTQHWVRPIKLSKTLLLEGSKIGFAGGEVDYAIYSLCFFCKAVFIEGMPLPMIEQELNNKYWDLTQSYRNELTINIFLATRWTINTLSSKQETSFKVFDKLQSENDFEKHCIDNNISMALAFYYVSKTQALLILDKPQEAFDKINEVIPYVDSMGSIMISFEYNLYTSLVYLKQYEVLKQVELLVTVNSNQVQMKAWADACPENFFHKYNLVEAELARVKKKPWYTVLDFYEKAIEYAMKNDFIQDTALANELCANYLLDIGKDKYAQLYMTAAYKYYKQWGATAKTAQIENRHTNILQGRNEINELQVSQMHQLDIQTMLKATQSLSQQMQLKGLIQEVLKVLTQNSGASKIVFLQKETYGWMVEADHENGGNFIESPQRFEQYENIPKQLISYVIRSKEYVLLDNVVKSSQFAKDPYFCTNNTKSVFVIPVKKHGELLALLYLENNLSIGVFRKERYVLINALATQLAISLENSLLYEHLEEKVRQRTQKLQEFNEELQVLNEELKQTQEEVQTQRDFVEKQNQILSEANHRISLSIKTAQSIQDAVLPSQSKLKDLFRDYFVINRPKDVVSGDFYWVYQMNNKVFLVVADCTGHGVPGAFMTLIGANILDKIIQVKQVYNPAKILTFLHLEINKRLHQSKARNSNGMDAVVISVESKYKHHKVTFAGAKNGIIYFDSQKNRLDTFQGTRKSIGGVQDERIQFENQHIILSDDSIIYLGSDGLEDQNNYRRKRFGRKHLLQLLNEIKSDSLKVQQAKIETTLENYMEGSSQRDDILWMGVKL